MLTDNFNVMLMGKPGTGKTSLALAMLDAVHKKNKTTMFVSTMAFSLLLKKSFNDKNAKFQVEKVSSAMKRADVLLLDDFGTEGGMNSSPVYD
ncbi:DNA replication protein, partial [Limosilactobacillus reuteri]